METDIKKAGGTKRTYRMIYEGTALLLQSLRAGNSSTNENKIDESENSDSDKEAESTENDDSETINKNLKQIRQDVVALTGGSEIEIIPESNSGPHEQITITSQAKPNTSAETKSWNRNWSSFYSASSSGVFVEEVESNHVISSNKLVQSPLNLDFSSPKILCTVKKPYFGHTGSPQKYGNNNFLKGCKWSPDGSCLLTNSEDKIVRVFSLKSDVFGQLNSGESPELSENEDVAALSATSEGDLVYDYCWYPLLYGSETDHCLYATTSRDHPIHVRDAFTGNVYATYRPINHLDEMTTAHSISFSFDGEKLYSGFSKAIRVFDVAKPGRESQLIRTQTKNYGGQSGIISCFAMAPTLPRSFAAASYGKTIGLYVENSKEMTAVFHAHSGGITHVQYSSDGKFLYSGGRKDSEIMCWDMRNLGKVYKTYRRKVDTNQRIYFELERGDRYLLSGGSNGEIRIWDVKNEDEEPIKIVKAHRSSANGVSLNPVVPVMATASGQRIFPSPLFSESDADSTESESETEDYERKEHRKGLDNSLKLWYVGMHADGAMTDCGAVDGNDTEILL